MKLYLSLLIALLVFYSCKNNEVKTKTNFAFFGGEIINPSSNFVVLEKNKNKADTIKLDGRNRFLFKIEGLNTGIYTFKHGGEYQLILLEANDSLLVRLNTLEFDESLVYTGKGSKKNNYFINEYLENENEERHILKLCQLAPEAYQTHIDSIKNNKLKNLKKFNKKYDTSKLFKKIAHANINFNYYSNKEVYPFMHYGKNKGDFLNSLPKDFYSYRKDINYNDDFFKYYHNYYMFLKHHFNTLSLATHTKHGNNKPFKWGSVCYNLDRLELIDSLVINENIKNELLHHFTLKYISLNSNKKNIDLVIKSYLNKATNEKAKTIITSYSKSLKNLEPGSLLPSFTVIDYNKNEFKFSTLVKSPTVVSFWSHKYYEHFKKSYKKIKTLEKKYPNVKFININIDGVSVQKPKQTLKDCKFTCNNQYLFKNPESSKKALAIYPMTKIIIIDKNKKIVNSNSNLFSIDFEEQLKRLF